MKTLFALLASVLKFRWLLNLVPGIGPFLAAAAEAIVVALKFVMKGLFGILTNPAHLAAAVVIAMVCVAGGLRLGVKLDAHLVREANQRIATLGEQLQTSKTENQGWRDRYADEQKLAADATKARAEAEAKVKADAAAADARARAKRLRDSSGGTAKGQPTNATPSGLFGAWKL